MLLVSGDRGKGYRLAYDYSWNEAVERALARSTAKAHPTRCLTVNPYGLRTDEDVEQAFYDGYAYGYETVADQAFADGVLAGYVQRLRSELVSNPDSTAESEYMVAFQQGWAEGWNDALAAMRESATEVGPQAEAVEFTVLGDMRMC